MGKGSFLLVLFSTGGGVWRPVGVRYFMGKR